jgi:hypothetical protein
MINIFDLLKPKQPVPQPIPVVATTQKPYALILLDNQLAAASQQHAQWAEKYYLQLVLDGLPSTTAAKQTSFKFFGSYQDV